MDKMSKMDLLWRILYTLKKRTDIFNIQTFEIDPFTNQSETFVMLYDKVDILGHRRIYKMYTCMQICPPLHKITQVPVNFDIII